MSTVDHLKFDNADYYPISKDATSMTAGGKSWEAIPKSFTIPAKTAIYSAPGRITQYNTKVTCIGAIDSYFLFIGSLQLMGSDGPGGYPWTYSFDSSSAKAGTQRLGIVAKNVVTNLIWGGSRLLYLLGCVIAHLKGAIAWQ